MGSISGRRPSRVGPRTRAARACADGQLGDAKRGMPFWLYRKVFCACSWMASLGHALKAFPGMIISLSQSESVSHIATERVSHIGTETVSHIGKGEAPRTGQRNTQEVSVPLALSGRVQQG
jgi:hypothetical protein